MDYAGVVERLEVALIELEYASADFAHSRADAAEELDVVVLNQVAVKLSAAHRAMQLAMQVLGDKRASERSRFAA